MFSQLILVKWGTGMLVRWHQNILCGSCQNMAAVSMFLFPCSFTFSFGIAFWVWQQLILKTFAHCLRSRTFAIMQQARPQFHFIFMDCNISFSVFVEKISPFVKAGILGAIRNTGQILSNRKTKLPCFADSFVGLNYNSSHIFLVIISSCQVRQK